MKRPAVFLDRDGVINVNRVDYVKSVQEFTFLPNVFAPLSSLGQKHTLVVISNQAAVGRGIIDASAVDGIHDHMIADMKRNGARIDGVYWCPHCPQDGCNCRKPAPGLLHRAARELNLDLRQSFMIGDAYSDVEAAINAGVNPVMVLTGRGEQQYPLLMASPHSAVQVCDTLADAVAWILSRPNRSPTKQ